MLNDSDDNKKSDNIVETNKEIFNAMENLNHDICANIDKAIKDKNDKDYKILEDQKSVNITINDIKDKKNTFNKNRNSLNVLCKEIDNLKVFKDEINLNENTSTKIEKSKKEKIIRKSPKTERFAMFDDLIGEGQFKKVYRAYDSQEGKEVAWNIVTLEALKDEEIKNIEQEISTLKKLKHERILNYISGWYDEEKNEVVFITELFSGGSLRSYLNKIGYPRLVVIKQWITEILEGLKYLHEMDIIHRDIKCDNIFINGNTGHIKIGDLGYCCMLENHKKFATTLLGTPEFMAPEVLLGNYSSLADIYSLGLCLIELSTLETPYKECSNVVEIFKNISDGKLPKIIDKIKSVELKNFIIRCLNDISQRPSAESLLEEEFLKEIESEENKYSVIDLVSSTSNSINKVNKRIDEKKNIKQNQNKIVNDCTNLNEIDQKISNELILNNKTPFCKTKCKSNNVFNIQANVKNKEETSNKEVSDDNKSINTLRLDSIKMSNLNIDLNNNTNMEMFKKQDMEINDESTSFYLRPSLQSNYYIKDENLNSFRTTIFDKSNSFENIILEKNPILNEIENNLFQKNMIFTNDFNDIEKFNSNKNKTNIPFEKKENNIIKIGKNKSKEDLKFNKTMSNDDIFNITLNNNKTKSSKEDILKYDIALNLNKNNDDKCKNCNSFLSLHCNSCYKLAKFSTIMLSIEHSYFSINKNSEIMNLTHFIDNKVNQSRIDISNGNINNLDLNINTNINTITNTNSNNMTSLELAKNVSIFSDNKAFFEKLSLMNKDMNNCTVILSNHSNFHNNIIREGIFEFNIMFNNKKIEFSIDLDKETVEDVINEMKDYNLLEDQVNEYTNVKNQMIQIINDYKLINKSSNHFCNFYEESNILYDISDDLYKFIAENRKIQYEFDIFKTLKAKLKLMKFEEYKIKIKKILDIIEQIKDSEY